MKTTLVRLSVLALAFTGFAAASISSHAASKHVVDFDKPVHIVCQPQALCAPSDPSHCGMD